MSKRNILVTGSHRSGTTWVGRTIAMNPLVHYLKEPFNIENSNPFLNLKLKDWFSYYPDEENGEKIDQSIKKYLNQNSIQRTFREVKRREGDSWYLFLKRFVKSTIQTRLLIKDPISLFSAGYLSDKFNLDVICMIRNPLAFVGSLKKANWDFDFHNFNKDRISQNSSLKHFEAEIINAQNGKTDFIYRACLLYNILHLAILDYMKEYPGWLFVKHEDLSQNPVKGFEEIFGFLELKMTSAIHNYIDEFTNSKNPAETTGTRYHPRNSAQSLSNWKKRLTEEEIEIVKENTNYIATQLYNPEYITL